MGASRRVVRWLKFDLPFRFSRNMVQKRGLPVLTQSSPPNLVAHYQDRVKQNALDVMIAHLTQKQCIREMSVRERGFFLGYFWSPKCQEVETCDRSLKAQRISHTGNLSNGHVSKGKSGRGTGYVCNVPRFIGCVPPHSHENRFASVPMLPSEGQALHVSCPTVRTNVRTVGIHTGSETSETFVVKASSHPIPLSRRLVQPIPVSTTGEKVNRSTSRTVPASWAVGESRVVRIGTQASDRISRRKIRFETRASIPHGGTPSHNDAASIRGKKSSRTSISKGGVATMTVVRHGTRHPIMQIAHETTPVGRDSSSTEMKKQRRMGTSHRSVSPSARVVDGPVTLAGRCVDHRLGCSIPGIDVEWDVAETQSPHKLVGVMDAIQSKFRLKGKTAMFMIDNSTTVSYLNKQGGQGRGHSSSYR